MAVVPTIPYRDVVAMVDWLGEAFGFQKQLVVRDGGEVKHAQLSFGDSTIMVFPVQDLATEQLVAHPDQVGGVETQTCYLVVTDVDAHFANAKAKGAEIVFGIRTGNYGGRGYACRDPEGHVWMFGTYDPHQARPSAHLDPPPARGPGPKAYLLALSLSVLTIASAGAAYWTYSAMQGMPGEEDANFDASRERSEATERTARLVAEGHAKALADKLKDVQSAKEVVEHKLTKLSEKVARGGTASASAQHDVDVIRQQLAQAWREREDVIRAARHTDDRLRQALAAKDVAEKSAQEASDLLDRSLAARTLAERTAKETTEKCEREQSRLSKDGLDRLARERSARAAAELSANELRNQLAAFGTEPQRRLQELRGKIEAEQRSRSKAQGEAAETKLQLAQEKRSRDAAERALRQAQQKLAANETSCWACPTGAPCERPPVPAR
jgi:uncharacterized glyoxalase superfamily protein PhnB